MFNLLNKIHQTTLMFNHHWSCVCVFACRNIENKNTYVVCYLKPWPLFDNAFSLPIFRSAFDAE